VARQGQIPAPEAFVEVAEVARRRPGGALRVLPLIDPLVDGETVRSRRIRRELPEPGDPATERIRHVAALDHGYRGELDRDALALKLAVDHRPIGAAASEHLADAPPARAGELGGAADHPAVGEEL